MTSDSEENKTKNSRFPKHIIIESMFIVSISALFISLGIIAVGFFRESFITGAIIGTKGTTSYAVIMLVFSSIITVFLSLIKTSKTNINS